MMSGDRGTTCHGPRRQLSACLANVAREPSVAMDSEQGARNSGQSMRRAHAVWARAAATSVVSRPPPRRCRAQGLGRQQRGQQRGLAAGRVEKRLGCPFLCATGPVPVSQRTERERRSGVVCRDCTQYIVGRSWVALL